MGLIDADALKSDIAKLKESPWFNTKEGFADRKEAIEIVEMLCVDKAPTIDPVKHGRWLHGREISRDYIGDTCMGIHYEKWWCSECDYHIDDQPLWGFCPNCGAKMEGVKNEAD